MDNHSYDMIELPNGYYEVEKTKQKINLNLPIHLGLYFKLRQTSDKPKLREEFEKDKHSWFVTPRAPQGKRTPRLFKVEFKGEKII